jgi:hypothetical protein
MSTTQLLSSMPAYRIKIQPDGALISKHEDTEHISGVIFGNVLAAERNVFAGKHKTCVDSVDNLPQWVQDRLVVLNMMPPSSAVDGVGVKLFRHTFWVFGDGKINTTGEKEWLQNLMK